MPDLKRTCGACRSFKRCEAFGVAKPECNALKAQVAALTAERDAAIKAACELFAFDNSAHKHWGEYSQATRELLLRQTDRDIAAAIAAAVPAEKTSVGTAVVGVPWNVQRTAVTVPVPLVVQVAAAAVMLPSVGSCGFGTMVMIGAEG